MLAVILSSLPSAIQVKMNILYLTTVLPSKLRTGGEIASQCFIDALKQGDHEVLVLGYQRKNDPLEKNAGEIVIGERHIEVAKSRFDSVFWMILSLIKNLPCSAGKYYSSSYISKITKLLRTTAFDVIIIDHAQMGWLEPFIKDKSKLLVVAHNVEHKIYLAQLNSMRGRLSRWVYEREALLIRDMDNKLANKAQEVWTFTQSDYEYFCRVTQGGTRVFALPSGLTASLNRNDEVKTCDIGLIGTWTWRANRLSLNWFFQSVYPCLPADLLIQVAGQGADWLEGKYPNVRYCGFVPSAQAFMTQARVIAIPSTSGSGIQIKTLDAIAAGSLIVATPIALRGIPDYPRSVRVAEKPEDFANSLVQFLTSSIAPDFYQEAIIWSYKRRAAFFADVAQAINTLTPSTEKPDLVAAGHL